jgi:hypothetical protein
MNIKTRHGYEKPIESDLEDYQLGWSIDEGCLYIKDPSQQGDKVLRVLSDKALLDANQKFIKELQDSLNSFSDGEIAKAKEELKKLYEKKTTYVIEFGVPADEDKEDGVDYTVDTEFDYYTKETADEAVASFIEKLNSLNIANQDPDIKNAGSKIIISKADHSVAYLYMILEDDDGKEYGQLINTLEQSFPSLVLEWSDKKENTIEFKLNDEVLNEINFSNMIVDEGSWNHGEGVKLSPSLDNEYIEYVSPICFRAKKDCYVRPNQYIEYDDDYAYGYTYYGLNGQKDFMTLKSETGSSTDLINNIANPSKIQQKLSENNKRNKYYGVFRIRGTGEPNLNGYVWPQSTSSGSGSLSSPTSTVNCAYNPVAIYNILYNGSIIEFFNNTNNEWEFVKDACWATNSNCYCELFYNSSFYTPTVDAPMDLVKKVSTVGVSPLASNFAYNSSTYRGVYSFTELGNNDELIRKVIERKTDNSKVFSYYCPEYENVVLSQLVGSSLMSVDVKVPSDSFIKIEKGYTYIILEALDLNSDAFIVPVYTDSRRENVINQLVSFSRIIRHCYTPISFYYGNTSNSLGNTLGSKKLISLFYPDSEYKFIEQAQLSNLIYISNSYLINSEYMKFASSTSGYCQYSSSYTGYFNNSSWSDAYFKRYYVGLRETFGFAPNYKYLNVKGLDEQ